MKKREKKKEEDIRNSSYFLDDSKMPSAEESKRFSFPEDVDKKCDDQYARITKEYALY